MTRVTARDGPEGQREGTARKTSRAEYLAREADPRPLLKVRGVADHLGVSPRTVYRLIEDGRLRAISIQSELRIRPVDLDAYLDARAAAS